MHTFRVVVVLDLDECLVHSVMDDSEYRQVEERKQVRLSVQGISTAKLRCQDGVEFHMHQRPGVNEFLQELSSFTDVYGFTAGTKVYAASAFQQLDPNKELFKHIWYRDSCTQYKLVYKKQTHIIYCKDLCKVFTFPSVTLC
jgi:RNA polymerase II subunit A small phosphatase-like protein